MQTQSIQNTLLNTTAPAAPKSTPSGDLDFKQALARQVERQPLDQVNRQPLSQPIKQPATQPQAPVNKQAQAVKAPPPRQAPAPSPQNKTAAPPPKTPTTAKPAQAANDASGAEATDQAASAAAADATDGAATDVPVTETAAPADAATADAAAAAAAAEAAATVDPMANMLAMIAAYHQPRSAPGPAEEISTADSATGTKADGTDPLAALQGEAGKTGAKPGADPAAAGKEGAVALPQGDEAVDAGKLKLETGGAKTATKAEAFAAKLAEATTAAQPVLPQATQAVLATAQAAEAAASNQLQARVGTNAWEQQLGQKVVWMVAGGDQSASLTLNPPDLGPLQIVLNVSNDQASVSFMAAEPETRQAIEDAMPKLRETMSEAGIMLGEASVSTGTQDQRNAFAEQAEARAAAGMRRPGSDAGGSAQPEAPEPVIRRTVLGAVDTFA